MAFLVVLDPDGGSAREIGLGQVTTTVGRGKANTVVLLGDAQASLRHATIARTAAGYLVADEGSTNGTWVNGEQVESRLLRDGDEVVIGGTVIRFRERSRPPSCDVNSGP